MGKPEWGIKRRCQACGANFYDLKRTPIVCPKCDDEFDPDASMRPRRSRAASEKAHKEAAAKTGPGSTPAKGDAKESPDTNLVSATLDQKDEEKVFDPSEALETEPDFESDAEGDKGQETSGKKKIGAAKKGKKDEPVKKSPAKPKAGTKKNAAAKKKTPAKEKETKKKEAKNKATKGKS